MVSDRHDVAEVPRPQTAVRVREHRAADPGSRSRANQGGDGADTPPLVEVRAPRGHEDHSPARLVRAQLAAMPVCNRGDDAGDLAQGHGGRGGSPGLVEGIGQA